MKKLYKLVFPSKLAAKKALDVLYNAEINNISLWPESHGDMTDTVNQLDTMADYLEEAHSKELEMGHHGDDKRQCSYCIAIHRARILVAHGKL